MPPLKLAPGQYHWVDRGIFARGTRKGLVYGISYTYRGRRRLEVVGPLLTQARQALAIRKAEISQGRFKIEGTRRLPRFPDFAQRYLEDYAKPNKRSWERDVWAIQKAVAFFGPRRLDEVTAWEIERYRKARLETGVTVATVNRDVALLKHMLAMAVRWKLLTENPAVDVKLGREQERPFRILSSAEEKALLAASAPHLRPIIVLALQTGLRHGELLALDWQDVSLARAELTVRRSKSSRVRTVPLNETAVAVLRGLDGRDGTVLRFEGRQVRWVDTAFRAAVRRAGIPHLRFHDLRHTFVSRLVDAGVSLPVVQQLAGHATIATTMRYAHVNAKQKREAVQRLDGSAAELQRGRLDAQGRDRRS